MVLLRTLQYGVHRELLLGLVRQPNDLVRWSHHPCVGAPQELVWAHGTDNLLEHVASMARVHGCSDVLHEVVPDSPDIIPQHLDHPVIFACIARTPGSKPRFRECSLCDRHGPRRCGCSCLALSWAMHQVWVSCALDGAQQKLQNRAKNGAGVSCQAHRGWALVHTKSGRAEVGRALVKNKSGRDEGGRALVPNKSGRDDAARALVKIQSGRAQGGRALVKIKSGRAEVVRPLVKITSGRDEVARALVAIKRARVDVARNGSSTGTD